MRDTLFRHFDAVHSVLRILVPLLAIGFCVYLVRENMACHARGGAYVRTVFWFDCIAREARP